MELNLNVKNLSDYLESEAIEHYRNHSIRPYLTMGIGGIVPLLLVVRKDTHLKEILIHLHAHKRRFILLGGGSNVVFPDSLPDPQFVVLVNRTNEISMMGTDLIRVNSGASNSELMEWNCRNNAGGMDFMSGVPGTVGGAAAVNAGAFGQSISQVLKKAEIVNRHGKIEMVDNDYFEFRYRNSKFKYSGEVIVNIFLQYSYEAGDQVQEKVNERLNYRREKHPCSTDLSAGCFFKNPIINGMKSSAGKLIDASGFKGKDFKTLRVSEAHSNFIINKGNAAFSDISALASRIIKHVADEKGVTLEREVIYISPEGRKY